MMQESSIIPSPVPVPVDNTLIEDNFKTLQDSNITLQEEVHLFRQDFNDFYSGYFLSIGLVIGLFVSFIISLYLKKV